MADCGCGRSPTGKCVGWHDLTEEQYRISKIDQLREEGKKLKPLGLRYAATSRAMAHKITELLSGQHYDPDVIDQYANAYMKR